LEWQFQGDGATKQFEAQDQACPEDIVTEVKDLLSIGTRSAGIGAAENQASAPLGQRVTCMTCTLQGSCLPSGLRSQHRNEAEDLVTTRRALQRKEYLYCAGTNFDYLYAVRSGSFLTRLVMHDGRDQITNFHTIGGILGFDGIAGEIYQCDAIALETSEVCAIPFRALQEMSHCMPGLQRWLHLIMGSVMQHDNDLAFLLGSMRADERMAAFILDLSRRFAACGLSPTEIHLPMGRGEIGSLLGLELATVSRVLSRFQGWGLMKIDGKSIHAIDIARLKEITGESTDTHGNVATQFRHKRTTEQVPAATRQRERSGH
jgi:CRP/FNR family transcriptional regulator